MADTPVVVQGTAVEAGNANQSPNHLGGEENGSKTSCNDPIFAALGYINLIAIAVVAGAFSDKVFTSNEDSGNVREYDGYIYAFIATSALSGVLSLLGMLFMMSFPTLIIKVALIFSVVMSAIMVVINVILQNYFGVIFSLIYLALVLCYARAVWARIPFATVNLVTSITAIRANFGIIFFAYGFAIMAFVWAFIWVVAFIGTYENNVECDEFGNCDEEPNPFAIIMLLLSFFFGQEILKNSIHVQVAGVTATWWISPEENGCCGSAVTNSFIRTMTTSFGSICFGSLLVAILQTLKTLARSARENGGIGACIAECILGCLEAILQYFNKWAFIYVGIYGFPYIKAGKSVFELFKNRGWEAIIADDLVENALFLGSLVVGLIMGGVAILIDEISDILKDAGDNTTLLAFFIGFLAGFVISAILNSTFASGVNAIIVLFADCPNEFQSNHPELSQKMRDTWREIYPNDFQ